MDLFDVLWTYGSAFLSQRQSPLLIWAKEVILTHQLLQSSSYHPSQHASMKSSLTDFQSIVLNTSSTRHLLTSITSSEGYWKVGYGPQLNAVDISPLKTAWSFFYIDGGRKKINYSTVCVNIHNQSNGLTIRNILQNVTCLKCDSLPSVNRETQNICWDVNALVMILFCSLYNRLVSFKKPIKRSPIFAFVIDDFFYYEFMQRNKSLTLIAH